MKKSLLIISMALLTAMSAWADVEINETNFPDENFRNLLLSWYEGADGVLTDREIALARHLPLNNKNIRSLKGIEFFTALTELNCSFNQLTELDLSMITALKYLDCSENYSFTTLDLSKNTELTYLNCSGNLLTSLDLSKNTELTYLNCSGRQLKELNISGCVKLTEFLCWGSQIKELDLSNNTALKKLYFHDNQLTTFNVSNNTALEFLQCDRNQLTELDVSKCTMLTLLSCTGNQLRTLDVSNNKSLINLYFYDNQIKGEGMDALVESLLVISNGRLYAISDENEQNVMTKAQVAAAKEKGWKVYNRNAQEYEGSDEPVSEGIAINETNFPDENFRNWVLSQDYGADGVLTDDEIACVTSIDVINKGIQSLKGIEFFTALKEFQCYLNPLTELDLSNNTALKKLYCNQNQLTSLDVSKNTVLTELNCGGNQLTSLDVSGCTALTRLECWTNQLTSLDVSGCSALTSLSCNDNQLTSLDVSGCSVLTELYCIDDQLTSLDVSGCTALKKLSCWTNQLTSLDVSGCTALTQLYCYDNRLTSLDVSKNTALTQLYCYDNRLTSLDVSKNTVLTELSCGNNQLTTLDVSKNTELSRFDCSTNKLTSLDVSKNTGLAYLGCYSNQLTELDVSNNTLLMSLYCYQNQIKGAAMDALVKSLPTVSRGDLLVIDSENEQNVMTTVQVAAAKEKGWIPFYMNGIWTIYEGSEPEPVVIAEETTVNPSENAEPGQATTTESGVTTSLGDEDVVDAAEGSVTIVSSMTNDAVKELIETTQPGSSYFNETFKGFYFLLAAGKGKVEFDIETSGGYSLGVMKGTELVGVYTQSTKGTVTIPYDLEEDTWFFAYPVVNTPAAANRAAGDGALKVYGLRIIPEESGTPDGINNLAPAFAKGNGVVYNLQGQRTDGLQKGLNIVDGKKVFIR